MDRPLPFLSPRPIGRRRVLWPGLVLAVVIAGHGGLVLGLSAPGHDAVRPTATVAPSVLVVHLSPPAAVPETPPPPSRPQAVSPPRPSPTPRPAVPALRPAARPVPPDPIAVAKPDPAPQATAPAQIIPPPPAATEPAAIACRAPAYPAEARRRGETGTVMLGLLIDESGTVIDRRIEQSSGVARLDEAALDALAKCRFTPGSVNGRPTTAWARLRYVWTLK